MNRSRMMLLSVVLTLLAVSCGPSGPAIDTPAQEMNLTGDDLGIPMALEEEVGLEEFLKMVSLENRGDVLDAHMRTFVGPDSRLFSAVLVFNSSKAAQDGFKDARQNYELALQQGAPDLLLEERIAPALGDEVVLLGAELSEQGQATYLLVFRKLNVVGLVVATGPAETITEDRLDRLGKTFFQKLPQVDES